MAAIASEIHATRVRLGPVAIIVDYVEHAIAMPDAQKHGYCLFAYQQFDTELKALLGYRPWPSVCEEAFDVLQKRHPTWYVQYGIGGESIVDWRKEPDDV